MLFPRCLGPHIGLSLAFALCAGLAGLPGQADELITNGSFEAGSLSDWTAASQFSSAGTDHFYVSTPGSVTPAVDGITFSTAANPSGGSFYAVTASDNPGAHALLQNFTVPTASTQLTLSFQMFVNDQSGFGSVIDPSGLDFTMELLFLPCIKREPQDCGRPSMDSSCGISWGIPPASTAPCSLRMTVRCLLPEAINRPSPGRLAQDVFSIGIFGRRR